MTRSSERDWPPPTPGRRGPGRSYGPFYQFKQMARDDGEPYKSPEPKAELWLLELLGTRTALRVMSGVLGLVVVALLVLLVLKA